MASKDQTYLLNLMNVYVRKPRKPFVKISLQETWLCIKIVYRVAEEWPFNILAHGNQTFSVSYIPLHLVFFPRSFLPSLFSFFLSLLPSLFLCLSSSFYLSLFLSSLRTGKKVKSRRDYEDLIRTKIYLHWKENHINEFRRL